MWGLRKTAGNDQESNMAIALIILHFAQFPEAASKVFVR